MVDFESNNLNISLVAGENITSSLTHDNLQFVISSGVKISPKRALSYIKSGQDEINDYVANVVEPQLENYVSEVQQYAEDITEQDFVKSSDFQSALDTKQDLISDLSTIRSGAALGATALQSGDNISELVNDSGFITSSYHDSTKQDTLVSGTNIKTINNTSILGSGNIDIQGGSDVEAFTAAEVLAIWEAN